MTQALETASRVDTKMVTGSVKRALINVCVERKTRRQKQHFSTSQKQKKEKMDLFVGFHCLSAAVQQYSYIYIYIYERVI